MNSLSRHIFAAPSSGRLRLAAVLLSLCSVSATAATAAANGKTAEIQARYEQERAKCINGGSHQDRTTCLKEAGAARDAALRGQLDDGDAKLQRNAMDRCKVLAGDEAKDCLARVRGEGTTSGSVEAGGIYRETVTREVMPAPVMMPAPLPASAPAH